ncbi:MAG TPA: hypothetical protein VFY29_21570 [Terriglobia bacterium]|nr:hypothetical protein [Terriglobia bacterium]
MNRLIGSALFRAESYEDVEADRGATGQAIAIVILSSVGAAVGTGVGSLEGLVGLLAFAIGSWIIWVLLTLFIGTRLLPEPQTRSDFGELLRTTGFSSAPGILRILGIVPVIGPAAFFIVTLWMLCTFVIAVRQALDYTSMVRAIAVCLLGWAIHGLFLAYVRTAL